METKILVCAFSCSNDPDNRFGSGKGGEGELGWNLVHQLKRIGRVYVLTDVGNRSAVTERMLKDKISDVNFYYISLPKILNFTKRIIQVYSYLWQIKAYFVARRLHKEIKFDVFHHITYANDWMASFIGALLSITYIRGPGGGAHKVPKAFLVNYSFKERLAERIRSIGQWFFRHDPFFIIGQSRASKILVCNKEAFDALPKKWQKKAEFFPVNGISDKDLSLLDLNSRAREEFCVITAGKLIKIKSFDLAIKAFEIFNKKLPDSEFVIVGDGPELEKLKKTSGGNVKFVKWMPREDLLKGISKADVFLFPSLRDGGGAVVVEAMAMAKPVVCFNLAGPGFHVDQTCGIKIEPLNPKQAVEDVVKALEKLYLDKELRKKLSFGARKKAEENYNWNKLGERLQKIYEDILKK